MRESTKRTAVLLLTVFLVALLALALYFGSATYPQLLTLAAGIVLGGIYLIRGSLPDFLHGESLTEDDDARNLSPQVYFVILVAAILLATIVVAIGWRAL